MENNTGDKVTWYTLTEKHMPPMNEYVLFWLDVRMNYGGFPVIGKRVQYNESQPYIRYRKADGEWVRMLPSAYPNTRWAFIPPPPCRKKQHTAPIVPPEGIKMIKG